MKLIIDGIEYDANLKKVADHLVSFYTEASKKMDEIDVGSGKKLDFGRKSFVRTIMKAAIVAFVVPMLGMLYGMRGLPPPKHEKHEDLIDWMVVKMLEFGGIIEGDIQLNATTIKTSGDGDEGHHRVIESISTFGSNIFKRSHEVGPVPVPVPVPVSGPDGHAEGEGS